VLRLVAHELRAHLTVLNGWSSMLLTDDRVRRDPGMLERALTEMRTHIDTLNDISSHLTAAVRGGSRGHLPVAMAPLDLGAAAREALSMSEETARRHGVDMRLDDRDLGAEPVRGDRFQLVVAMRNLLDNACAHGPEGGTVILHLGREHGDVLIEVQDEGKGLNVLGRRAFEPLRRGVARARRRERSDEGGLGLGLSLVAEVARCHGGDVVWGRRDGGACIGMRLPDRVAAHA
jgi:signal transduction histidine kinase